MSDITKSIEVLVKEINNLKMLVENLEKPKGTKPKAEPKEKKPKAEKPEAEPKAEKNLPRMSPAITAGLKAEAEKQSVEWSDEFKKEFAEFANAMSPDDYKLKSKTLAEEFFETKKSVMPPLEGQEPEILTVDELHTLNKNLTEVSPGIFRNKLNNALVTGPEEDSDEDFEEAIIGGVEYMVGHTTKRVYQTVDESDTFTNQWIGVGKLYDADF